MKKQEVIQLLERYLAGTASSEETAKVEKWYDTFSESTSAGNSNTGLHSIKERLYQSILQGMQSEAEARVIPFYRKPLFRVAVAAVFLLICSGIYLTWFSTPKPGLAKNSTRPLPKRDIAPPTANKAILTLADGTKIEIDSSNNGKLAEQGNIDVIKQDNGQIVYNGNSPVTIVYNTLTVPRGSKPLQLALADGSKVWLNVASSITFPTAFTGKERKVEITGEAYFEIAHDATKPFHVVHGTMDVQVLGTHFNVNTYDDEKDIKVTLLEGSVRVTQAAERATLEPGQQAQFNHSTIQLVNPDLEEVMAWKNGRFYFDGADIKQVMRQIEKWYNVEVKFESDIPYSFVAKISRNVNVSEFLKILESTNLVHFTIVPGDAYGKENKIIVMK